MDDVAGESAETEGEFATEIEKSTGEDKEAAEEQESAAEFADRIHGEHSSGTVGPGRGAIEERFLRSAGRRPRNADGRKKPACSGRNDARVRGSLRGGAARPSG